MEHTILVAMQIHASDRADAHEVAQVLMPRPGTRLQNAPFPDTGYIEAWWVAEDDRRDGSDNDSAVFVAPGFQQRASRVLFAAGLTASCNLVDDTARSGQFVGEDSSTWPLDGDLR